LFGASDKTTVGRVPDIRVGRITSLSLLVLSHPRRENAGHHSHLRHWSCWMRTLNGTHIPQVRIRTGTVVVWWDTGYWDHTCKVILDKHVTKCQDKINLLYCLLWSSDYWHIFC